MRYLTLMTDYTGFCIQDDFEGQIDCLELELDKEFCTELEQWNDDYKVIIPLDCDERSRLSDIIKALDDRGIFLAKKLADTIQGGAKVKYFSEGKSKILEQTPNLP